MLHRSKTSKIVKLMCLSVTLIQLLSSPLMALNENYDDNSKLNSIEKSFQEIKLYDGKIQNSRQEIESSKINSDIDSLDCQDMVTRPDESFFYAGLSIDGGGIRGLIPAVMANEFETIAREYQPKTYIYECFDYIGGSSVGGILSLALTAPDKDINGQLMATPHVTIDKMIELFEKKGSFIFQKNFFSKYIPFYNLFNPKFESHGIEVLLKEYLQDRKISEALTPVVVTAVDHSKAPLQGFLFDTHQARLNANDDFLMTSVGRATSAAQTYFPEANIRNLSKTCSYKLSDGGLWRNNPANIVYDKIIETYEDAHEKNMTIISLGTGETESDYNIPNGGGLFHWIKPLLFGQMNLSGNDNDLTMKKLKERYIRLQPQILDNQGHLKKADLADLSPDLIDQYKNVAEQLFKEKNEEKDFVRIIVEKKVQKRLGEF